MMMMMVHPVICNRGATPSAQCQSHTPLLVTTELGRTSATHQRDDAVREAALELRQHSATHTDQPHEWLASLSRQRRSRNTVS